MSSNTGRQCEMILVLLDMGVSRNQPITESRHYYGMANRLMLSRPCPNDTHRDYYPRVARHGRLGSSYWLAA